MRGFGALTRGTKRGLIFPILHSQAGDALIFTEALTHGTLVWQGEHQRRSLIYKYSPFFQAHAPGYHQTQIPDYILDMSDEERAMLS